MPGGRQALRPRKTLFGEILTQCREESGMTQKEAAEKAGLFQTQVYSWETGRTSPAVANAEKLLKVYGYELEIIKSRPTPPSSKTFRSDTPSW